MKIVKGMLYVRYMEGEPTSLFFSDQEVPDDYRGFHYKKIAEIKWGETAKPFFSNGSFTAGSGTRTGAGYLIEYVEATDEEITTFFDMWSNQSIHNIAEWVANVQSCWPDLDPNEKARVVRLAEPYM